MSDSDTLNVRWTGLHIYRLLKRKETLVYCEENFNKISQQPEESDRFLPVVESFQERHRVDYLKIGRITEIIMVVSLKAAAL